MSTRRPTEFKIRRGRGLGRGAPREDNSIPVGVGEVSVTPLVRDHDRTPEVVGTRLVLPGYDRESKGGRGEDSPRRWRVQDEGTRRT